MREDMRSTVEPDPLAAALLPVLLHRLNNATQVLTSLNALLSLDERGDVLTARAGDLAHASHQVDELGWQIALVGAASGAPFDVLRRSGATLTSIVAIARECLRREGRDLADCDRPLPTIDGRIADGWQLPWSIAAWLWTSGRALPTRSTLVWELTREGDRQCFRCHAPWSSDHEELMHVMRQRLPAVEFSREAPDAVALSVPSAWVIPETTA